MPEHYSVEPGSAAVSRVTNTPAAHLAEREMHHLGDRPARHSITGARTEASAGASLSPRARSILQLQRTHGNRYVQRALALNRQADGTGEIAADVESSIERSRGGGHTMDASVQTQMESAFGTDFNGVRIHTGAEAHSLNRAVNAVAFTTGQDIFFRDGAYDPGSSHGKELLAHELTHVVQQGGAPASGQAQPTLVQQHHAERETAQALQPRLEVSSPQDAQEIEAENTGRHVRSILESTPTSTESQVQRLRGDIHETSVLARGLSLARESDHAEAVGILERSAAAYASGAQTPATVTFPGFSAEAEHGACSCGGHCPKCAALQRSIATHSSSNILARDPAPAHPGRTKTQCINNALSSAGIPWAIIGILGSVCGMIGAIAGLGGGPAAPATVPSGAAVAAAVCIAAVTGLSVGFVTGVIIKCCKDPSVEWTFASNDTPATNGSTDAGTSAAPTDQEANA